MLLNIDWLERQIHTLFLKSLITICIHNSHVKIEMQNQIYSDEPNSRQTLNFTSYTVLQITPKIFPYACVPSCFSCVWLCDPVDCSLPGSSVHGILQARILEWVAMASSRRLSWHRDRTPGSCIAGGFFTTELQGSP